MPYNPAAHPLYMIYLNEKLELNSIEMSPDWNWNDGSNSDYPYISYVVYLATVSPREKFFPIDFIYHSYLGKGAIGHYNSGNELGTQKFTLHLDSPMFIRDVGLNPSDFLSPLELHASQNLGFDAASLTSAMFRAANTTLTVFLKQSAL
jgi:hypothetical protein